MKKNPMMGKILLMLVGVCIALFCITTWKGYDNETDNTNKIQMSDFEDVNVEYHVHYK